MRVFITGASGWIGSAVVPEVLAAGHEVIGLARTDESAAALAAAGAAVHRGSLDDPGSLRAGAEKAEGVIHLAYNHDFHNMAGAAATDRAAIEAFGDVLAGTNGPLLVAAGTLGLTVGRLATEDGQPSPERHPRIAGVLYASSLADRGVRSAQLRFAPTVHGEGDHGFVATLAAIAKAKGVSGYVGDGSSRWPAVHRSDAGRLVALALDNAVAGSAVHVIAEEGVSTREIAEAIGEGLGVPTASIPQEQALEHFDWLGHFFGTDSPASNALTRERFGWTPTGPTLLEDLRAGHYTG